MNCRNKIPSLALIAMGSLYGLTASAKCGSVNYSQGADALAMMHDYVVTMMLYEIFGQNHTHISYLQIKLKVLVNHL